MENMHIQFSLLARCLFLCRHNRYTGMASLQVVLIINFAYAQFCLQQPTQKLIYTQAKKVRKKNNIHVFHWEKRVTMNCFLRTQCNTGPASEKKKSLLAPHFASICPNFVWLIALNCHVFEKQQQIKRKLSAGEKICFREEEKHKKREGIINMANYMNILFIICFVQCPGAPF